MVCPAITFTPPSLSVPANGKLSIRTPAKLWPASASLKAKSAGAKTSVVSSSKVLVILTLSGGVLLPTFMVSVLVLVAPLGSLIV